MRHTSVLVKRHTSVLYLKNHMLYYIRNENNATEREENVDEKFHVYCHHKENNEQGGIF